MSHDITIIEEPVADAAEIIAAELRVATFKENSFVRGWRAAGEPEIRQAIESSNAKERARCKAALLARFSA